MRDNLYRGTRDADERLTVTVNGRPLTILPSFRLRRHSGGFECGYGGSGPAQLALAILVNELDDDARALALYQAFKWHTIVMLPQDRDWELMSADIAHALAQIDRETCRPRPA